MSKNQLPKIESKQIGKNLNVTIEGDTKLKTLTGSKEELSPVKDLITSYKAKPTKKLLDAIQKALTPVTTKKVEEKKAVEQKIEQEKVAVKGKLQQAKKETKRVTKGNNSKKRLVDEIKERLNSGNTTQDEINELEALIKKQKETIKSAPASSGPTRNRER
jgi:chromosome segregation ATPase